MRCQSTVAMSSYFLRQALLQIDQSPLPDNDSTVTILLLHVTGWLQTGRVAKAMLEHPWRTAEVLGGQDFDIRSHVLKM